MQQSPFALATPVAPAVEPQASFAANWFVSGIGRLDGEDFVTIKARDLSAQFSLYGHDTNVEHGVTLDGIEWSEKIGKSIVIIKKGIEIAKLEFNEAEMHGPAQSATATAAVVAPAGGLRNGTPPMVAGARPMATPPARIMPGSPGAQRPTNPAVLAKTSAFPPAGQPPAAQNPLQGQERRRIRAISPPQQQ